MNPRRDRPQAAAYVVFVPLLVGGSFVLAATIANPEFGWTGLLLGVLSGVMVILGLLGASRVRRRRHGR